MTAVVGVIKRWTSKTNTVLPKKVVLHCSVELNNVTELSSAIFVFGGCVCLPLSLSLPCSVFSGRVRSFPRGGGILAALVALQHGQDQTEAGIQKRCRAQPKVEKTGVLYLYLGIR